MKRAAIFGAGFIGMVHAKNVIASKGLELCALVDSRGPGIFAGAENSGNAGSLGLPLEQLKKVPVYTSASECLRREKPEVVLVCVPLFLHCELAALALENGADVLVEKPFCSTAEECRSLMALAERLDRILMVAHCIRFSPQHEFLATCIREKTYGSLLALSATRLTGQPSWGSWKDRKVRQGSGGALFDLLIHDLDFAQYSLGTPEGWTLNHSTADYWDITLHYGENSPSVGVKGGFLHASVPFRHEIQAVFENATLAIDTAAATPDAVHIYSDATADTIRFTDTPDLYRQELTYFTQCTKSHTPPTRCLPNDSLKAIELCSAIRDYGNRDLDNRNYVNSTTKNNIAVCNCSP